MKDVRSGIAKGVQGRAPTRVLLLGLALAGTLAATCAQALAVGASATLIAANCAPVAASSDGTMVWYARNGAGVFDAYIGNGDCQGAPLLPAYDGNRGPAGITANGRYVLLTTAEGWDRTLPDSSPGQGSGNSIQLYDRQTGRLSTLLAGASASQRGVIWPTFNANATKIVWSQLLKTASEDPPVGEWALHVADVNLEKGTLSDNVEWQDPDGKPAFYEAYGWVPGTNRLIFMSNTRSGETGFRASQLFTLPEELSPGTAPTRISPEFAPVWPWQSPVDVFHEFAHFAPNDPYTLYTSIGADTVGGDDLFSYDLRTQAPDGLLGQPTRLTYFGGDLNLNAGTAPVPGWPSPAYTVVTTMAWVDGAWDTTTCPDLLCSQVNAWRIGASGSQAATVEPLPVAEETPPRTSQPEPSPPKTSTGAKHKRKACATVSTAKAHAAKRRKSRRRARAVASAKAQCKSAKTVKASTRASAKRKHRRSS
ncbi:MAG TPA: hypothetical protein VKV16_10975 [Solirubrobacteraceae bacterium]|nr:hypothetical protein [Solirubrobacteraceae bacterium]